MEITEEIQALLDAQKAELTTAHDTDLAGIKKNRDDLLEEKRIIAEDNKTQAEAKKAADELAAQEKALSAGDTKSLQDSFDVVREGLQAEIDAMKKASVSEKLDKVASAYVDEYAKDNQFIKKSIAQEYKKRIDSRDGKIVVLDADGALTANTIEDLNKEFNSAPLYQDHLKGTGAIGGGATGNKSGGAVHKKPCDMSSAERIAFKQADPEGFKKADFKRKTK